MIDALYERHPRCSFCLAIQLCGCTRTYEVPWVQRWITIELDILLWSSRSENSYLIFSLALGLSLFSHNNRLAPFRCPSRLLSSARKASYLFPFNRPFQGQHRLPQVPWRPNYHCVQRRRVTSRRNRTRTFRLAESNHRPYEGH